MTYLLPILPMVTSTPGITRLEVKVLGFVLDLAVRTGLRSKERAIWFGWRWIQRRATVIIIDPQGYAQPIVLLPPRGS